MRKLLLFLFLAQLASAQQWSGIVSSPRAVDWSGVGVPGGIPSAGWTQCGATIAAYGTSGSPASPATINAAIIACTANHYVQLGAGNFYLNSGIVMKSGVEVRGFGPDQTKIFLSGLDSCGGLSASICFMGVNFSYGSAGAAIGGTNSATWTGTNATTGTYTAGATSIRLTNIGSSGIINGDYIYLDQNDDSAVANGFIVGTDSTLTPPFSLEGGAPGRCSTFVGFSSCASPNKPRSQIQIVKVTAGCATTCTGAGPFDLTIAAPGIIGQNWRTSQSPGAWFPGAGNTLKGAGVQGVSIDYTSSGSCSSCAGIALFNASENWVYNVRSIKSHRNHIVMWQAAHNTILSNYLYDTFNAASQSYGMESFMGTSNLMANTICQHITTCHVVGNDIGSVFADNFAIDSFIAQGTLTVTQTAMSGCPGACLATYTYTGYTPIFGGFGSGAPISIKGLTNGSGEFNGDNMLTSNVTGSTFQVAFPSGTNVGAAGESATGLVSNGTLIPFVAYHDAGVNYNLFEGNIGNQVQGDVFHGTSNTNTLFRNYLVGYEKSKNVSSAFAVELLSYHRYQNVIGNLLGRSGTFTGYESYTGCGGCSGQPVYSLGFGNTESVTVVPDMLVRSTLMRWGNYDTVNAAVQWNSAEVPSGLVDGYANPVPASHTLPASFAFSSKPSWYVSAYGSTPWPGIGPDVTGGAAIAPDMTGTTTAPGGFAYANPAELCYLNAPIDTNYPLGLDRGVLLFRATDCYTATAPSLNLTPSPVNFGNQNVSTTSSPITITVQNVGSGLETLSTPHYTVTGTNPGDFLRTGGSCFDAGTIPAGSSCTEIFACRPSATGARSATLTIVGTVNGTDLLQCTGTSVAIPVVQLGPRTTNFGTVNTGTTSAPTTYTLQNIGTATLNITSIVSSDNIQFPISGNLCGSTLAPSASCTFADSCSPTTASVLSGTITVTTNASSSPDTISLSCTGFTPAPQPTPAPAPVIFISANLPAQPIVSSVSLSGPCAVNNKCIYIMSCSQCSASTQLYIDNSQVSQTYSSGTMTYTAKLAAGTHSYLAVNLK